MVGRLLDRDRTNDPRDVNAHEVNATQGAAPIRLYPRPENLAYTQHHLVHLKGALREALR